MAGRSRPERPLDIGFRPQVHPNLPVEVVERAEIRDRGGPAHFRRRQRADFHQIVLCTSGRGLHHVDFEPIEMRAGTALRIHPGPLQQFQFDPHFDASMVIYRSEFHRTFTPGEIWFPGSDTPTHWSLDAAEFERLLATVDELRSEQAHFDGAPARAALMESLLGTLLARLNLAAGDPVRTDHLPEPYLRFRHFIESRLHERPPVAQCADQLGYSTRTIDRACQAAAGRTAKEVLNERITLEVRRLLTHSELGVTRVGASFGFADASSFSKFVQRHLGASPSEIRDDGLALGPS